MNRFRRVLPVVAVALGAGFAAPSIVAATTPPDTTEPPDTTSPDTTEPTRAAREHWLTVVDRADADTFAGGASVRELVEDARVLMIGDSIMASTSRRYGGEMCRELVPRGWEVEVDAETGRFVDFGGRVLDARLDAGWDAAVVMLGNNYGADKAVYSEYLEEIVDRLAPRPTVLLTVTEFRPDRADVNDAIYEIAADYDNVRVVDWATETANDPELVGGDGLHLSDKGRQHYADLVGRELGRAPDYGEGDCLGSDFTDDSAVITPVEGQVTMPPSTWPNNQGGGGGGGGGTTAPPVDTTPVDTTPTGTAGPTVPTTVAAPEVTTTQPQPPTPPTTVAQTPAPTNPAPTTPPSPTTSAPGG
jgi:hypothetical protein